MIKQGPCPYCNSSDAYTEYENNYYCFSCKSYEFKEVRMIEPINDIRGIRKDILIKYGIRESNGTVYFPTYSNNECKAYKTWNLDNKHISSVGDRKGKKDLFGSNLFPKGSRKLLIITEGEFDCLSTYQMLLDQGKDYAVVSLPDGANTKSIKENLEYVESFETVILSFDQDEIGKKCANETVSLLSPGKSKVVSHDIQGCKDANDCLTKSKSKEYIKALLNAHSRKPDGIILGQDTWGLLNEEDKNVSYTPYPWSFLNDKLIGIRKPSITVVAGASGCGKTQFIKEIEYHLLINTQESIGVLSLEETVSESVESLMSLYLNKRIVIPSIKQEVSKESLKEAWEKTSGTNRIHYYKHEGESDVDSISAKIRYLVKGLGCSYIVLDNLTVVVDESEGQEYGIVNEIMATLRKLRDELKIAIFVLAHLRKAQGSKLSYEEGLEPSTDAILGSGRTVKMSNVVISVSRNQYDEDEYRRNTCKVRILKNRTTGETGDVGYLHFDKDSGKMIPIENTEELGGF